MEDNNGLGSPKIALLIDFDNVVLGIDEPGFDVELVVNALRERGNIVLGRAYGDWYRHNRHRRKLMEQGLELVETPAFGPVIKNSADIRIALDGFEIAMTQSHIDTFCIVSGDSDFLPLIKKLQVLGKNVLVICGTRFTSDMLRRNCNEFIAYENLLAASVGASEDATTLEGAFALLHRAMDTLRERGSEIRTSTLKQMMLQLNPVFSEKNFGCNQFRQFLDKAVAKDFIKIGPRDRVSGELYVLSSAEEEIQIKSEPQAPRHRAKAQEAPSETTSPAPALDDRSRRARIRSIAAERRRERVEALESAAPEVATNGTAPAVQPTPALVIPEVDENPAAKDVSDHSLTRTELLARGMRRGRLKFSGKTGRLERLEPEATAVEGADETVTVAEETAAAASTESAIAVEATEPVEVATPATAVEESNLETEESATEEKATEDKPKTTRRRRSTRKKAETAPEQQDAPTEAPAAEAPAVSEAAPTEAEPTPAKKPARRSRKPKAEASTESATTEDATPAAIDLVPGEEASAEAAPAKKPTRRRRTTRKAADNATASEE